MEKELSILVVEADDTLRRTIKSELQAAGAAHVAEVPNGAKALGMLLNHNAHPIDILVFDLNMPGMDGMELIRHLSEERVGVSVIIFGLEDDTLFSAVDKMAEAYGVKLLGMLQRPVTSAQLEEFFLKHRAKNSKAFVPSAAKPKFTLRDIQRGIEDKQFRPFFQAKVDINTGVITGAEALARWVHPTHGVVTPDDFIEVLESNENINGLTFLILKESAKICKILHDAGSGSAPKISVNLSLTSLNAPSIADDITKVVKAEGLDPKYIVLEITESATMSNVATSLETLARLRMRGFGLSIDDYGTGSSNIQQMTRIPFSELKIDKSFVNNCTHNKDMHAVVKTSIELAHKLKINCVAEGVEVEKDWHTLKGMGCDTAQGFLISKPMDIDSFLEFYFTYNPKTFI